jgi:lysophospholipid acyltransferase (LPLAT)-like uncharacterized protein
MFRRFVLPWLVYWFYRLWSRTWRLECIEPQRLTQLLADHAPVIFAHWHGSELCIVTLVPRYRIATMTSTSKDGQLIDAVIRKLGGATSKGSSTRGGVGALKGLIRLVRSGYRASMAVDGPKGPLHQVKAGVFELSRLSGGHIVPVGTACANAIVFQKSWNKASLPKPFSRVIVHFGEPWKPIQKEDSARSAELAHTLAEQISSACKSADELLR